MRRTLGRGLSQLIAEQSEASPTELPIRAIVPNSRQPRTRFDDASLQELAASIRLHGLIQPLIVRPLFEAKLGTDAKAENAVGLTGEQVRYELIAGERRLRASRIAGLDVVPVVIRPAGNQSALEIALIENLQRDDMNALDCARSYRRLIEEFGLTQEQVAERVGKSRTSVANTVRLLRLPLEIQESLENGQISEGHARALLSFDTEEKQLEVFRQVIERALSVREVEQLNEAKRRRGLDHESKPAVVKDANLVALESALSRWIASPTRITQNSEKGSGKLTIEFYGDEDLQRILDRLGWTA